MPFKSQAQRAYMHIHHPEIAERFEAETPKGARLPQHAHRSKTRHPVREEVMRRVAARGRKT